MRVRTIAGSGLVLGVLLGLLFAGGSGHASPVPLPSARQGIQGVLKGTVNPQGLLSKYNPFETKVQDTTYIRQYAKDAPQVLMIYSGPDTHKLAEKAQNAILSLPECQSKPSDHIRLIALEDAESMVFTPETHRIFLISGSELKRDISDKLKTSIPGWERVNAETAIIKSDLMHKPDQKPGLTFQSLLYAPDPGNLYRLLVNFMTKKYTRWTEMPRTEMRTVNHLILFSDEESRSAVADWGSRPPDTRSLKEEGKTPLSVSMIPEDDPVKLALDDKTNLEFKEWHPISEAKTLLPAQTKHATMVYFINRKLDKAELPGTITTSAYSPNYSELTTMVSRQTLPDETNLAIFTAPDQKILEGLATVYYNIDQIKSDVVPVEVSDLSQVKFVGLDLTSSLLPSEALVQIRDRAISSIRNKLNISIAENGASQRYQLHAKVTQYDGETRFLSMRTKLFQELPNPVDNPEPKRSAYRRGPKGDEDYHEARRDWENERIAYVQHSQTDKCSWHLEVDKQESVKVSVDLQLVDQQKAGSAPLWEDQITYTFLDKPEVVAQDEPTVIGYAQIPAYLPAGQRQDKCSQKLGTDAVIESLSLAFGRLQASCKLPDKESLPPPPKAPIQAYIAKIQDNQVSIILMPGDRKKLNPGPDGRPLHPMVARVLRVDELNGEKRLKEIGRFTVTEVFQRSADCTADAVKDKALLQTLSDQLRQSPQDFPLVDFSPQSTQFARPPVKPKPAQKKP